MCDRTLVYRPSIDYRDILLTNWKKDSKPYVFLLLIPDSSRALGKPIQPPRSPLVSDAKIQNAAEKQSKPGLNVEWNRGSASYSSSILDPMRRRDIKGQS